VIFTAGADDAVLTRGTNFPRPMSEHLDHVPVDQCSRYPEF